MRSKATRRKRLASVILCSALIGLTAGVLYFREELQTPYPPVASNVLLDIPKAWDRAKSLDFWRIKKSFATGMRRWPTLYIGGNKAGLQAGEYLFDRPMTLPEVMNKLLNGSVLLHKFTVPEGLTLKETALQWESQKYGTAKDFLEAATASVALVQPFDEKATSVEGYLFPETYSFPSGTTARQVVEAMVSRFGSVTEDPADSAAGNMAFKSPGNRDSGVVG